MTTEHEASRTLVKSPPELWAECSDAGSLARHLGEFGDISITRLDPETTVAWEGEHASGTVRIEPSGWGTRVTLTAKTRSEAVVAAFEEPSVPPEASIEEPAMEPPDIEAPAKEAPANEAPADDVGEAPDLEATAQEENDATLEETLEAPDAPLASGAGAFRIRWRRVTAPMRGLFRSADPAGSDQRERPAAEQSVTSVPPPTPSIPPATPSAPPYAPNDPPAAPDVSSPTSDGPDPEPASAAPEPEDPTEDTGPAAGPEAQSAPGSAVDAELILTAALDSLGQAHHRPFSRA